jgi:hypothetical protein
MGKCSSLIEAGQNYLGVTGKVLTFALAEDVGRGATTPGPKFLAITSMIGGQPADPASHIKCVMECLEEIWSEPKFSLLRMQATSHLLRQLLHGRYKDHGAMLAQVYVLARQSNAFLARYIPAWTKGHFITGVFRP